MSLRYQIETKNKDHHFAILKVLKGLGYKPNYLLERSRYNFLQVGDVTDEVHGCGSSETYRNRKIITIDELIMFEHASKTQTVKLNDQYSAVVSSNGTIQVGCQTFEFDDVDRLKKAMIEVMS